MSRYLYEHLFLGHLVFEGDATNSAFRIIRSAAAPGAPAVPVATRRPYDDPGVARVYYRLVPERETLLAKTHMPYLLSPARMAKFAGWFLDADYRVDALPSYELEQASNPFITFAAIPPDSRYRFMLDEAEFFIMNFIKGPGLPRPGGAGRDRGSVLGLLLRPEAGRARAERRAACAPVRQPAPAGGRWQRRAPHLWQLARAGCRARTVCSPPRRRARTSSLAARRKVDLSLIWDGDGRNPNAALTVFRHFDSASVVKGLVGDAPKTAWVLGYPLFERIYYLLVAGYDPYGNRRRTSSTAACTWISCAWRANRTS